MSLSKTDWFLNGIFVGTLMCGVLSQLVTSPAVPDVVVVEVHETITQPLTIGYTIPGAEVVHLPDPQRATLIGTSWVRFDQAVRELDRKIDELRFGELQCHTALSGWEHATTQWNAACRGVEEACR
jgi:hypothetical protein